MTNRNLRMIGLAITRDRPATTAIKWDSGPHQNARVTNNLFASHADMQILFLQANSTTGVAIDHNLWFLAGADDPSLGGAKVYAHAAWSAATAQGSGDVFGDPQLAGAWALPIANLQPTANSPAVDKDAVLAEVTTDLAGAPRPVGAASHEIDQDPCEHALATGTWVGYNPAQRLPAMPSILVSV